MGVRTTDENRLGAGSRYGRDHALSDSRNRLGRNGDDVETDEHGSAFCTTPCDKPSIQGIVNPGCAGLPTPISAHVYSGSGRDVTPRPAGL